MWRVAGGRTVEAAPFEKFQWWSRGGSVGCGGGHKKRAVIYLPSVRETLGGLIFKTLGV